jgi:hypothetical protein
MGRSLRLLIVEDSADDVLLMALEPYWEITTHCQREANGSEPPECPPIDRS